MPIQQRVIQPNIAYGEKYIYESAENSEVLGSVAFSSKVGTICQILTLSTFANEIFTLLDAVVAYFLPSHQAANASLANLKLKSG